MEDHGVLSGSSPKVVHDTVEELGLLLGGPAGDRKNSDLVGESAVFLDLLQGELSIVA